MRSIKKAPPYPYEMHLQKKVAENDEGKANLLNQYFQSVFKLKTNNTNVDFGPNTFNKIICCEKQVTGILSSLKSKKAKGPDRIGNETLKQIATTLAKSLTVISQTCFNKGLYPQHWKESEITPIYKDGDKSDVTNYIPINCLCFPSKVLEKVIFDWLYPVIRQKLQDSQFGFRDGRSATIQIIYFLDEVYLLNDSSAIDEQTVFYLDFEKTFDKVPHDLLLLKIHKIGICGTALKLIANYLDNRKQCVKINNSRSEFRDVTSGVPQGSLLGPLLFLIYINDLPTVASESECFGYADDYKLLSTSHELLESDLISLNNWCVANKMNPHDDKCTLIHFKKQSEVKMNEVAVKPVNVQKDLGVLISNDLSWKENCNLRRTKSLKSFWFLKRNISFKSTTKAKLNAYTGYVVLVISYACKVWYPIKTDLSNIEIYRKVQHSGL